MMHLRISERGSGVAASGMRIMIHVCMTAAIHRAVTDDR